MIFTIIFRAFTISSDKKYSKGQKIMHRIKSFFFGVTAGILNSLFGAGGGILIIPYLKSRGLSQKSAQVSALPVLIILSFVTMLMYLKNGYFSISNGFLFVPFGLVGSLAGSLITGKIPDRILSVAFSLFLLYSGIRMLLR